MTGETIGVVICSFNAGARLADTLNALGRQTRPHHLVVVDDGSTDNTADIARSWQPTAAQLTYQVISHGANRGLSTARNTGAKELPADVTVIAYTDDDCIPPATWVQRLQAAWQAAPADTAMLGGEVTAYQPTTYHQRFLDATVPLAPQEQELDGAGLLGRARSYLESTNGDHRRRGPRAVLAPVGANMSVRADLFAACGGFDETIAFYGDENALAGRLKAIDPNAVIWHDPTVMMEHNFAPSLSDSWRRCHSYGRGAGREWARHGGIPSVRPGVIAAAAATLVAGPVGGVLTVAAIHRRWLVPKHGWRAEQLTYPLLLTILEARTNQGIWRGWREQPNKEGLQR